uniref:Homogentisate phytyltransferase n=1 Tax=Rhizophora mucronata TaxID=61149 RepID=A0A2P2L3Q1_RHIMU
MHIAAMNANLFHLSSGKLIEYAVPRTKLMKRAQNNGHEPAIHPSQKLMMEKDAIIATPVPMEYSPDANGRYGLLTLSISTSVI